MSKTLLNKELKTFSDDQLREIILKVYDFSPEAKNYFEFFLNPDVDALLEKFVDLQAKEIMRGKYGECNACITVLKKNVRQFAAYGVGAEYHSRFVYYTFRMMLGQSQHTHFKDTLRKGISFMASQYVQIAAANGFVEEALNNISSSLQNMGRPGINREITAAVNETVKNLNINLKLK